MEEGYPKFDNKGANNIVTLRVPRFGSRALYDPVVETGYETGGTRGLMASVLAIAVALMSFIALQAY